ncbi:F-box protein At1g10780 [Phalaenopsis equestris]|uniref:F-box protein At1g10780 n=1 Tax=Phalaenopsis equestris TaxID=78828 RepID=UPI0009E55A87|nr:F-box protein At1g10780 [Phalaenopsis equestris]XP_020573279.1 F-box protein At1g10780 [Phalaenopsis equestris]XP_020573281.1 F-box protein At1g10780 [Phalaenopsis equestris]XP_020573282.1 F-box protein At1g10780 [Phalaenopsis equestris]XP_020573283.1 F-box protein At1g10780 [Phalaenopsis equestris]
MMDMLPDAIIQQILSHISNARDVAACSCVSKRWKDCVPYSPSLYFPRNAFHSVSDADSTISRIISIVVHLEELVVYCPFSAPSLASWISLHNSSLRILELRMDSAVDKFFGGRAEGSGGRVDCIGAAHNLETLKLWGVSLTKSPSWGVFKRLKTLEIIGAALCDDALKDAIKACPNLTDLALLACDGVTTVSIELEWLERCRLDFLGPGNCSLSVNSMRLQVLEIQGFSWVRVNKKHKLRSLCISKNTGRLYGVDTGKLVDLEHLSLRGVQWSWNAISSVLQCASDVKHLVMKIEFCGDFETLQPFPEIDLVEFFNNHPKLITLEIHGAMFAALCQKNSLRKLDSSFVIPNLEEVLVTVRSPLNAEQKLNTLESLVDFSVKLRKMVIRISQMKNCHETADDFFEEICRFKYLNNDIVHIE